MTDTGHDPAQGVEKARTYYCYMKGCDQPRWQGSPLCARHHTAGALPIPEDEDVEGLLVRGVIRPPEEIEMAGECKTEGCNGTPTFVGRCDACHEKACAELRANRLAREAEESPEPMRPCVECRNCAPIYRAAYHQTFYCCLGYQRPAAGGPTDCEDKRNEIGKDPVTTDYLPCPKFAEKEEA